MVGPRPAPQATQYASPMVPAALAGYQQLELESARGQTYAVKDWARWSHPKRVAYLRRLANEYAADPRLRWFVVNDILRPAGVPTRDEPAMAQELLRWVQENVYYTQEFDEQIQSPWRTLSVRTGDCDDAALLLSALASAAGLECRMVLAGRDPSGRLVRWAEGDKPPSKKVEFFHIYCEFRWPRGGPTHTASAEPTFKGAPLGYDLVYHGITTDAHGRPFLGQVQKDAMRGLRKVAPNESAGEFYGDASRPALFSRAFMVGTLTDGVSAAVVSIVTFIVMEYVQDWWRGRRHKRRRCDDDD